MLSKIFAKLPNLKKCEIVKTDLQTFLFTNTIRVRTMTCCVAINLLSLTPDMKQQNVAEFLYLLFDCSTAAWPGVTKLKSYKICT